MHRMVLASSLFVLVVLATHTKAGAANTTSTLPTDEMSDNLGETPQSINSLPWIVGDKESQRREWIKKAYELRDTKSEGDEAARKRQIDAYLKAADRLRSSTFTRCNLGLLAHERGDVVEAAEHFRNERSVKLSAEASGREKFIRHVCDTYAALAFERVGELKIEAPDHSRVWINHQYVGAAPLMNTVYVKPNEEQNVRIQLPGEGELRETVSVRAGRSTTLEFQSPSSQKSQKDEPKALTLPKVSLLQKDGPVVGGSSGLRQVVGIAGGTLVALGLGTVLGAAIVRVVNKNEMRTTMGDGNAPCEETFPSTGRCGELQTNIDIADAFTLAGAIVGAVGGVGLGVYFFTEGSSSGAVPSSSTASVIPKGVGITGTW